MKVSRNTLLLIAALVWLIAGFNILRIGITAYLPYLSVFNIFLSIIIFVLFQKMVFGKLVIKHTYRINGYTDEKHFFLKFFDKKAFLIMAFMICGGISLRAFEIAPERFIAVFYSGLGASLMLAGILFGANYRKALSTASAAEEDMA